ncbi:MAG: hypothetical protein COB07_03715 [Sulfurovum sp.]|nr:MAG: hypothetical protein COB07_03715 [Sulfurovum sp.]
MKLKQANTLWLTLVLVGCGGGGGGDSFPADTPSTGSVTISGTVTYDLVPANANNIGLDYDAIRKESVKGVRVDAIDISNTSLVSTTTDSSGHYTFSVPNNTQMKIRVSAKMLRTGTPSWDVKVIDNTNSNALYVMEGALSPSGTADSQRHLNASSGWGGTAYTSTRTAAPFAVLDNAYSSMQTVLSANANTVFPPLQMNWSISNISVLGDTSLGQITTSHYSNGNLFILGDADSDTDEYDDHVIAHEWGHYYEDKFSRSDSIGGSHGQNNTLDIRVAFGEGWGNAFSAMALEDPDYFDTLGLSQASGFTFNVESGTSATKGWYSESSVQRILYDVYDSNDDSNDTLSLGFAPIHKVFTGAQKSTPAFTSIFTFINALKDENTGDAVEIDEIVSDENITTIADIYGTGRIKKESDYPYHDLIPGTPLAIKISNADGTYNKLSNRQYVKFTIASSRTYSIKVEQSNGTNADPDFYVFDTSPFSRVNFSDGTEPGVEEKSISLTVGDYLLDVSDYKNILDAQLTVTID